MSWRDIALRLTLSSKLPTCDHRLAFGSCGRAGEPNEITHQKDENVVASYEGLFRNRLWWCRNEPIKRMLEIGVCRGGSLAMWRTIFSDVEIIGVDKDLSQLQPWTLEHFKETGIQVREMTMPDERVRELGRFDLIIDDGEHGPWITKPTFELLWPQLNSGGLYIIEDWMHVFLHPLETLNFVSSKLIGNWEEQTTDTNAPASVHLYRGLVAIEKKAPVAYGEAIDWQAR